MLLKKVLSQPSLMKRFNKRCMGNFIIPGDQTTLEDLKGSPSKKIFYFTASWCPPCKKIAPIFEKLSSDHATISFVKIDIDDFPTVASDFGVRSVPTFFFLSGKKTISEFTGAAEQSLISGIKGLEDC